ncbi:MULTISPECIES: cytochrome c oxidase assembly protein [Nocardia]|uniref:cytochrome c oxidase assembly protein n=1 Tax=Nocardia TaxID=1817 RepID=UPI000593BCCE|nr:MULTISPECIES: cytochrome c oxidase assembly protein [Nocardia]
MSWYRKPSREREVSSSHLSRPAPGSATLAFLCASVAGTVAALVVGVSAARALSLLGLPDPGPATTYGLPALRALADLSAAATIGSLLFAAFLTPPQPGGLLDTGGYRAMQRASLSAMTWACCAALLVPSTVSDTVGQPLGRVWRPEVLWRATGQIPLAQAWATTAVLAALLAVSARLILRWRWTPLLLGAAVATMMPLALSGHSSSGGAHDLATNSLVLHLISAALWVGGLFAVLVHALRGGAHTDLAARRFSSIATVAFVIVAGSGVINSWVRVAPGELFTTTYGRLVLAKIAALTLAGVLGVVQRRAALPALAADPRDRGALIRFGGIEVLIFAVTVGLAVGLGRTPPPPPTAEPTPAEVELGYTLSGAPSAARLLVEWRFDLIFGTSALVLALVYLLGVRRLRARGQRWPSARTIAWLAGCVVVLLATSSGVGRYAHAVFSVHMGQIMALSALAPILLTLGGPLTLALRAVAPAAHQDVPGAREWILAAMGSPISRALTHPVVASVVLAAGLYALYPGGIYHAFVDSHAAHLLMNLYFLIGGYLFFWVLVGIDETPRPITPSTRLAMALAALPSHAVSGLAVITTTTVMGGWFFGSLALGWNDDLLGDQTVRGGAAWAVGEIPLVIVVFVLLGRWARGRARPAEPTDRRSGHDPGTDIGAAMRRAQHASST